MTILGEPKAATDRLLDDRTVVGRVLAHLDAGTTDLAPGTWTEPVSHYRSPDRLAAEIDRVLRRFPTVLCPAAALPEVGSYLARDVAGVPLVGVRGRDGRVRAFRNACRHRGTAVVAGRGCARSLVCPYHGWTYGLDGSLRHVPDAFGFPGLDAASHGLVPVRAEERAGLVLVTQHDGAGGVGRALGWLPELLTPEHRLIGSFDVEVAANWKVLLEGTIEGYHIKATHRETFFPLGYDNVNVVETFGRHSRVTFPFRRIETLRDRPPAEWHLDGMATLVHHVFPNTVVVRFSHHTTVIVLEPLAPDRTRLVTYRLARAAAEPARAGAGPGAAERDVDFVDRGGAEDLAMAEAVQRGLAAGADEVLTFGRFEGAIAHVHRQLHEILSEV